MPLDVTFQISLKMTVSHEQGAIFFIGITVVFSLALWGPKITRIFKNCFRTPKCNQKPGKTTVTF